MVDADATPIEASDLFLLRKELNQLRHEVQQARTRHRRCQSAQTEVRRLRERCKQYEALYVSLRAGDRTALAEFDKTVVDKHNVVNEVVDCSRVSNDAATKLDHMAATKNPISDQGAVGSSQHSIMQPTDAIQGSLSHCGDPSTSVRKETDGHSPTATPARSVSSGLQKQQLAHSSEPDVPQYMTVPSSMPTTESQDALRPCQGPTEDTLHAARSVSGECRPSQHHFDGSASQQSLGVPSLAGPDVVFDMCAGYHPSGVTSTTPCNEQGQREALVSRFSMVVESPAVAQRPLVYEPVKPFPSPLWVPNASYPPMAFTQCSDLMEKTYEEYCARIFVNAQH